MFKISYDMTFQEKIIIIGYFILFMSFIFTLIFRNIAILLLGIFLCLILAHIYTYYENKENNKEETLEKFNRDIIYNETCVKPNLENPFMNPTMVNIQNNPNKNIKACYIDNEKIRNEIDYYFKTPVFKDVKDIYERNFSDRQFYTVPSSTIPNNQGDFAKWLYYRKTSCKEGNGQQCYNNIM